MTTPSSWNLCLRKLLSTAVIISIFLATSASAQQVTAISGFHASPDPFTGKTGAASTFNTLADEAGRAKISLACTQDSQLGALGMLLGSMETVIALTVTLSGTTVGGFTVNGTHSKTPDLADPLGGPDYKGIEINTPSFRRVPVRYTYDHDAPSAMSVPYIDSHSFEISMPIDAARSANSVLLGFNTSGGKAALRINLHDPAVAAVIRNCNGPQGENKQQAQQQTQRPPSPSDIFTSIGRVPVGNGPGGVALGDFNHDGKLDVVTTNAGSNSISVLLGQGGGRFGPQRQYTTGGFPDTVAVADLDGDGKLDIIVSNYSGPSISVFMGNGDGTFEPSRSVNASTGTTQVIVADLNRDGHPDLIASSRPNNNITVLMGRGDGGFERPQFFRAGSGPVLEAAGDLNGDGFPDVVVANEAGNTISIFLGRGDGTFNPQLEIPGGNGPIEPVIADFNHDGKMDIAVANDRSNDVSVFLGNGHGMFSPQARYAVGSFPKGITSADINDDRIPDIVVTDHDDNTVAVLLGKGDGTFQRARLFPTSSQPVQPVAADLNGDHKDDVIIPSSGSGVIDVLLSR